MIIPFNLALVSMPWSLFNRPSIQIGALKAFLEQEEDITVDGFHPYLGAAQAITTETYLHLCKNSWAGEALYSSILFPEQQEKAKRVFTRSCRTNKKIAQSFHLLRDDLRKHLDAWLTLNDFSKYQLIGFTVTFSQLLASLAAAKEIKKCCPDIPIVFGGSSCVGDIGTSLVQQFSQVDFVIEGEGEHPLKELCRYLQAKRTTLPQQIGSKDDIPSTCCAAPIKDLNTLPPPDYHPYFAELSREFPGQPFVPTLPIEFSRGCWWEKCTFCNLNLQWQGYRWKSSTTMLAEVQLLHKAYQCLDFSFCDNALPPGQTDSFFQEFVKNDIDFRFFAEIRAIREPEKLMLYRNGGLAAVQVGIESLSTSLLEKMAKGTTVIENLAIMKHCLESDIQLDGNLIVEFPGATEEEIAETLINLDYALPFHPLVPATFFLGFGSRMQQQPQHFGIKAITQHRNNLNLFPKELLYNMETLIKDYRGDRTRQKRLWQPVRQKMKVWKQFHSRRENTATAALSYRDGGSFLLIRQEQPHDKTLLHRLHGMSRKLYLYCGVIRSLDEILQQFPTLGQKTVLNFFDDLSNKNLLFRENDTFLALAVRATGVSRQ